ncbi:MAG: Protein translocase subunit SecA [Candidatus Collierbacteria bacterium GW2011_GWB1_45_35]|uniref:Protein translocase subunit SecA n=1 Tax=Candidatus Collierbacteria bacterium GW2011_GWB2_45_17 TaxID=1618388 RepID=A0A837IE60_9BACT|nr:MAG: Protein translocase subunit SecA [Microgenomates group bacterium GW2011_GWC1_44_23]KKT95764.1 MAG: Protein translocase subunit SecA [Candidatus Collierbacteria bacterium GW2011_GWA1_45_15]KKU00292.1 MAG: Protein translocase subunit SecA [Candidatus Collierbacteria bacterium GW2011_GWB2_45_17]KKU05481.1 MAG: Protein translocase subunit SecA [Candidatus Collierbacteria bacterium GW2011_GWB1_45_35]KKU08722.1 MAG: Protein translocase subunit SecA [Candidatus Collierbacteria bacterium GW2011
MFAFLDSILNPNKIEVEKLKKVVSTISALEASIKNMKDDEFAPEIAQIKKELKGEKTLDDVLPQVFALTREASIRTLGLRPYDVQLMAGIVFHQGKIAEQKTGEGKTLSAVPAMVLNALTGEGAHLVTVNDYLARRDAGWMGPIYHFLGLTVGCIFSGQGDLPAIIYDPEYTDTTHTDSRLQHMRPASRAEAYACDITYGTNNEFGFDYLRDNMARSAENLSQRPHHFAIVDEVDSILIDEARTPLIISAPDSEATDQYFRFADLIKEMSADTDFEVDEKQRTANLTDHGLRKLEKTLKVENLYQQDYQTLHHLEQALKAQTLFVKDRDYIVKDDEVIIVDDHTGRLMYGRRYSDGLHQAIEAKEGVKIQQESRTLATISLQNYFRLYKKLAGMTGTAHTEAEEFKKIYNLDVIIIPTNMPNIREDFSDIVYKTQRAKYSAIMGEVSELHAKGQPVLIGTKSIEQNDIVGQYLKKKRIPHQVLNAKNHENEAMIISEAGRLGAVTVATNIAGRGVDIVLGGDPTGREIKEWNKEAEAVKNRGGLHILGAVRHESRRIDNQLRGRSGRQGDQGSSRFYISLEDDIMRIFGGDQVSRLMDFLKVPEDQPLEAGMVSKAIETAQSKVESFYFDQRKHLVDYDDVMNKQRQIFYSRRKSVLTGDEKISSAQIDTALEKEINYLSSVYEASGVNKTEADQIVKDFQSILPLDPGSANSMEKSLPGQSGEEVKALLGNVISQARASQKKHFGDDVLLQIERFVILDTYDELWMNHLDAIDNLRDGIGLRGYAQKDPLVEYKQESFAMFESLLSRIDSTIAHRIFRVQINIPQPVQRRTIETSTSPSSSVGAIHESPATTARQSTQGNHKLGRNDPCFCGSGKKWKNCHYPKVS